LYHSYHTHARTNDKSRVIVCLQKYELHVTVRDGDVETRLAKFVQRNGDFCSSLDSILWHADVYVVILHRINKQRDDVSGVASNLCKNQSL